VGKITASFGVSPVRPDDSEVKIFRQVDKALYRAKEMGRNRVELFRNS
ncbi:MAG: diguanylate cyclase, partial [Clostridia bacterium]|nr:diguanylate cyclase [Clostridia bacterium]